MEETKEFKMVGVALVLAFIICFVLIILSADAAYSQTQDLKYQVSWQNAPVKPDESDKPDGTQLEQRVMEPGSTVFTAWAKIHTVPYPSSSVIDFIWGDPGDRTICYRAYHYNQAGVSGFSNEACIKTPSLKPVIPPAPPSIPTGLQVVEVTSTSAVLEWQNPVQSAHTGVRVFRAAMQGSGSSKEFIFAPTVQRLVDTNLRKNTRYCYTVEILPEVDGTEVVAECLRTLNK